MSRFSASEAALEGFRITRENPRAFAAWAAVSFAVSILGAVVTVLLPAEVRHGLATLSADETPDARQLLDALIAVAPILALGLAIQCIMAAGVYRLIFRHDDVRFRYLRLGADEARLMGLTLIYVGLIIGLLVAVTLGAAIIMALASFAGNTAHDLRGLGPADPRVRSASSASCLRPALAGAGRHLRRSPASRIFESWELTRGAFLAAARRLRPGDLLRAWP